MPILISQISGNRCALGKDDDGKGDDSDSEGGNDNNGGSDGGSEGKDGQGDEGDSGWNYLCSGNEWVESVYCW